MIVYVDTNFLLELTLLQEEEAACRELLAMNASRTIELCVPACAVAEAIRTVSSKQGERHELLKKIRPFVRDFRRSTHLQLFSETLNEAIEAITFALNEETKRLDQLRSSISDHVTTVPLDHQALQWALIFESANVLANDDDRMIFATVMADALRRCDTSASVPLIFVTRDKKDFSDPEIKGFLDGLPCALLFSFGDAVAYIRHRG